MKRTSGSGSCNGYRGGCAGFADERSGLCYDCEQHNDAVAPVLEHMREADRQLTRAIEGCSYGGLQSLLRDIERQLARGMRAYELHDDKRRVPAGTDAPP